MQVVAGEPGDDVAGEVDGVELDMSDRVQQRDPARARSRFATARHFARRAQLRARWPGGARGWRDGTDLADLAFTPGAGHRMSPARLVARIGRRQDRDRRAGKPGGILGRGGHHSTAHSRSGNVANEIAVEASTMPATSSARRSKRWAKT